ncbi:uncharacterized protein PGTG_12408 [Puccinia graminis f. sp. tritici CRL 75-36-700-3]|uniref:Uncharacterized protein n=1 Tax=Puccinia graminis f. sp. tritici (strain CRL 75-36-700-3 / race SCCL) TaxID=418459 RepID=E3KQ77_PUCGT|nr:uncharacterized protein PGTG_12408 [Puccinia graminis f. sp. tritici CRL 75-36-700-3]EFP86452.2 hypothetical protein PGTG_12408 [Puccinia graminis f. sp. tritici CRL 75-36-700-3]
MCKEKQRISGSESAQATIIIYNNPVGISVTRRIIFFPHPAKRPTWGFSRCKAQVMNLVGIFLTSHRGNSCWLDTAHPTSGPRRRSSRGKLADVMSTEEVKPMTLPCVRPAWRACQRAPTTPGPRDRSGGQPDPTPPAVARNLWCKCGPGTPMASCCPQQETNSAAPSCLGEAATTTAHR